MACVAYVTALNGVSLWEGLVLFKSSAGYAYDPYAIQVLLAVPLMGYGLVWACLSPRKHYGVFSNSKIVSAGGMTYELYLLHYPVLVVLKALLENRIAVILVGLALTFAGTIMWNKSYALVTQKIFK